MKGSQSLVILFKNKLRIFRPGEVIETNQPPHSWFKEVATPKPVSKMKGFKTKTTTVTHPKE